MSNNNNKKNVEIFFSPETRICSTALRMQRAMNIPVNINILYVIRKRLSNTISIESHTGRWLMRQKLVADGKWKHTYVYNKWNASNLIARGIISNECDSIRTTLGRFYSSGEPKPLQILLSRIAENWTMHTYHALFIWGPPPLPTHINKQIKCVNNYL